MKKLTFGTPENLVPSVFCKGFSYVESEITYPVDAIDFFTKEPVANGWLEVSTDSIPVYERVNE